MGYINLYGFTSGKIKKMIVSLTEQIVEVKYALSP